ncbi:putative RNA methyltransferase [Candidatus Regiella insecticola LSR1]|uniref:tRNA (cytidine/uridine-2'-O-)-methyltransferase TrmJ n=1 Tax=Candidatus Regiella insecticola LSR1 TaxID=663321 RepID=E0WUC7_9ENTR|nr:tRNA (cytosine(32)/uridine(32)-2'-O)-methyltransferase TrmJ [Candidatus Regiella insecticola]EFL91395.1 putative RNA methyltransferase [Candidatus Regiella insecticola LSR1]
MLHNIRIILVEPSHPGNIGSAARAMKTMGLTELYLVDPLEKIDSHTIALAAGASNVIDKAKIVDNLDQAVAECSLIIGTSARSRTHAWPMLHPRECGVKSVSEAHFAPVALVFGRERSGLTNHELQKCHFHVEIPTNPEYSSLNLAMAVQVIAYEIRNAWLDATRVVTEPPSNLPSSLPSCAVKQKTALYPPNEDLERFYQCLEQVLGDIGFIRQAHPGQIMTKLRRLFTRARLETVELHILRGILHLIDESKKHHAPED